MLSLDSAISPVGDLTVGNVALIMRVHLLEHPVVVLVFGPLVQKGPSHIGRNNTDSGVVTIILQPKAPRKVGPRKRHNLLIN